MPTARSTVVFDLDGTLVDSLPDIIASFRYALVTSGRPDAGDAAVHAQIGKPLEEMFALLDPDGDPQALSDVYRAHYRDHFADRSRPFPGVADLLAELGRRGYLRAVATTKRSGLARTFAAAMGLAPLLDHVQGTDAPPHKPAPDVVLRAIAAVGGDGGWMVGDSDSDIEAGRAAGLRTYAVSWGTHDVERLRRARPDVLEPNLDRLLTLLE
jgi:phosphoglycolate phosphatase